MESYPSMMTMSGILGQSHDMGGHKTTHVAQSLVHRDSIQLPFSAINQGGGPERVAFYSPVSAIVGSHLKTDLESCLALVRRKVAEKFGTTLELITHIRRNRFGDSGHVTPNEFRYTLIKLGVQVPAPMADEVFKIFDSDRSGSINFDEFATWVMNSEFKPKDKNAQAINRVEKLRDKFGKWATKYPDIMREHFGPKTTYSKFYDTINRKCMKMTEPEVKDLFRILDPQKTGFIDGEVAQHWVDTGKVEKPLHSPARTKSAPVPSLEQAITKVCGKNVHQLEWCFLSVDPGRKQSMTFDDFNRNLTEGGLSNARSREDVKALFMALGGATGQADIGKLLKVLPPMMEALAVEKAKRLKDNADAVRPSTAKVMSSEEVRLCRVDRLMREGVRRSYDEIKTEFDAVDKEGVGYVEVDALRTALRRACCPIASDDFDLVVKNLRKDGDGRVQWTHFLQVYATRAAPHSLQGPGFTQAALALRKQYLMANPNSDKRQFMPRPKNAPKDTFRPTSALTDPSLAQPVSPSLTEADAAVFAEENSNNNSNSNSSSSSNQGPESNKTETSMAKSQALAPVDVRQRPQTAPGPDFGKSFLVQSLGAGLGGAGAGTGIGGASVGEPSPAGGGLAATRQRISEQRAKLCAALLDIDMQSKDPAAGVRKVVLESDTDRSVRKTWAAVLKDCHRYDPEGLGCVSREDFVAALMNGNLKDSLDEVSMDELAVQYAIVGSEGRMVDYVQCFKTFLTDAADRFLPSDSQLDAEKSAKLKSTQSIARPGGLKHPWEFDYFKREKEGPGYWERAMLPKIDAQSLTTSASTGTLSNSSSILSALAPRFAQEVAVTRGARALTATERDAVMDQYPAEVRELCAKAYSVLKPNWREVRLEFKKHEIPKHRGHIFNYHFMDIITNHGVVLNVWERPKVCHAFRVGGMARTGVINFDSFQRVCVLVAIAKIKSTAKASILAATTEKSVLPAAGAAVSVEATSGDSAAAGGNVDDGA